MLVEFEILLIRRPGQRRVKLSIERTYSCEGGIGGLELILIESGSGLGSGLVVDPVWDDGGRVASLFVLCGLQAR